MITVTAIELFVAYVGEYPDWNNDAAIADLVSQGVTPQLARDVVYLTPIAFGRSLLLAFGVHADNSYVYLRSDGSTVESGELSRHEVFQAAMGCVPQLMEDPSFRIIASSSSEVRAVKQAIRNGSPPGNLMLGPVTILTEPRSQQSKPPGDSEPGPWWRFWK